MRNKNTTTNHGTEKMNHTVTFALDASGMELLAAFICSLTERGAAYSIRQDYVGIEVVVTGV